MKHRRHSRFDVAAGVSLVMCLVATVTYFAIYLDAFFTGNEEAFVQPGANVSLRGMVILFALLPAMWLFIRYRTRTRYRVGHCRVCGYDLRATPDRCPECGAIPPVAAKGAAT